MVRLTLKSKKPRSGSYSDCKRHNKFEQLLSFIDDRRMRHSFYLNTSRWIFSVAPGTTNYKSGYVNSKENRYMSSFETALLKSQTARAGPMLHACMPSSPRCHLRCRVAFINSARLTPTKHISISYVAISLFSFLFSVALTSNNWLWTSNGASNLIN